MNNNSSTIALEFAELSDINDVAPLSEDDELCLQEIKGVLKKHNALSRFGIALLHTHFPVNEGEILVERCDPINRKLTISPEQKTGLTNLRLVETNWRFDVEGVSRFCYRECIDAAGYHITHHTES